MIDPDPCPKCGKVPWLRSFGDHWAVMCCGLETCLLGTTDEAAYEWNLIARSSSAQGNKLDLGPGVVHREPPTVAHRSVLDEAAAIVEGARRDSYGTPAENHGRTAALWSAYLGVDITARQVCMLNILQKISRDAHSEKRDNLVDIAGYALNAELVEERP